ncbi:MAG: TraR/DksA family transcriptional regulator [Spirochaetes bacterium]|jgi:RNA polymerase-binding protein DksA|nr:TraR/DksA family transcriptional regulator [Spirochaetota bacterium]
MDKEFVERMKQKLLTMKKEILDNLVAENEDFQNIIDTDDSKDLVDIASTDIDKRVLDALGAQEMKRLNLIDAALARIEAGKYGICLKSGKPIPTERLEAIPYALYRIEYQNELERRNR